MKWQISALMSRVSMTVLLALALAVFLGWAAVFEIEQSVRAQGQVIAASRTQIIQAVDGGVLSRLLVNEGERVAEGQLLAALDPERATAAYQEARSRVRALEAALVRLEAEVSGTHPRFDDRFDEFTEFVTAQLGLYVQRRRSLDEQVRVLNDTLAMLAEELEAKERLYRTGDVSQMEMLRSRQQIAEARGRVAELRNRYLQESRVEITRVQDELLAQRERLAERRAILIKNEIKAPIDGLIKYLRVTTIGGVLRPGDELMQIVPSDGEIVLEVKIPPSEIGQLRIGLPVSIKLDAYDFSVFGALDGELVYLSPDTLTEQGPGGVPLSYYRAHVRISDTQTWNHDESMLVMLGMSGTVDIRVGSRTILGYIAKPIVKTLASAMSER